MLKLLLYKSQSLLSLREGYRDGDGDGDGDLVGVHLQTVELSQRTQAAVQIVSNLPAPSNGARFTVFWACRCSKSNIPPSSVPPGMLDLVSTYPLQF